MSTQPITQVAYRVGSAGGPDTGSGGPPPREFLGHPMGLYVLFGAEMWERFSYYGMRALLVLYLVKSVQMPRAEALHVLSVYMSLVYLTPMLGGWLADVLLGRRKAVIIGGSLMALGHLAMAFEPLLYLALGLLILGNGFFKPNISTMVGGLYPPGDSRRDGAYTVFYMGINLGAFLGQIICGVLGEKVGWHWGFSCAGVCMVLGLINFTVFQSLIAGQGLPPGRDPAANGGTLTKTDWLECAVWTAAGCVLVGGLVWIGLPVLGLLWTPPVIEPSGDDASSYLLWLWRLVLATLVGLPLWGMWKSGTFSALTGGKSGETDAPPLTRGDMMRMAVIGIVAVMTILFWTGFEQAAGTMNLFADEKTDRVVGGFEIPATWFQSINPLVIVLLAPLFSWLWISLSKRNWDPPATAKQGLGMIVAGAGFIVMYMADNASTGGVKVGVWWLTVVYVMHTIGELLLSPVGLSFVNKLSPARVASLMMAVWFLSNVAAGYLAGNLEHLLATHWPQVNLWILLTVALIGMGVLMVLLTPLLERMARSDEEKPVDGKGDAVDAKAGTTAPTGKGSAG